MLILSSVAVGQAPNALQPGAPYAINARVDENRPIALQSPQLLGPLLDTYAAGHVSLPLNVTLPTGSSPFRWVTLLLWLPANFGLEPRAWPTVFFLHGTAEGVPELLSRVRQHGLPHKIEQRAPFNRDFVLVSPQRPDVGQRQWHDDNAMRTLEALRVALFANVPRLDRSRTYLTGLSHGGDGVWNWAGFYSPPGTWAAIVPTASMWPDENAESLTTGRSAAAIAQLSTIRTHVSHCMNDRASIPCLSARGYPRCLLTPYHEAEPWRPFCGIGPNAIVEALHDAGATQLTYERVYGCNASGATTDSDDVKSDADPLFRYTAGHDAWKTLYNSNRFVSWLLAESPAA